MMIKVKGYLTFRKIIGEMTIQEFEVLDLTIIELLRHLSRQLGEVFSSLIFETGTENVSRSIAILVNGVHYSHLPEKLETRLQDGDQVAIFPPIAGG